MDAFPIVAPSAWRPILQQGDRGADVASWQAALILDGRDLGVGGADGQFGKRTHQMTIAYQRRQRLRVDGIVGPAVRGLFGWRWELDPVPINLDTMRMVQAKHWSKDIGPQRKQLIVLHSMEAGEAASTAENCAAWFAGQRGEAPRVSAHYCVDSDSVIQCVPEDRIAWHAPGANRFGIGIELAGYARQTLDEWRDDYSRAMLANAARLCVKLCAQFNIPAEFSAAPDLKSGEPGITTHREVSKAFGKSTHTDPGRAFPMSDFLSTIRQLQVVA